MLERIRNRKPRGVFLVFLTPYLMFIIITIVAGIISVRLAASAIEEHVGEAYMSALTQAETVLDNKVSSVLSTASVYQFDSTVTELGIRGECTESDDRMLMRSFQLELKAAIGLYPMVSDIVFYFPDGGFVLGNATIYRGDMLDEWSRRVFFTGFDELEQELLSEYIPGKFITFTNSDTGAAEIVYARTLGSYPSSRKQVTMLMTLTASEITSVLREYEESMGAAVYLLPANINGEAVSLDASLRMAETPLDGAAMLREDGSTGVYALDGERCYAFRSAARPLASELIGIAPAGVFLKNVNQIRNTLIAFIAAFTVVGVVLALYFTRRNASPAEKIVRLLSGSGKLAKAEELGYSGISEALSQLMGEYRVLERDLDIKKREERENFLERLTKGELDPGYIDINMEYYNVELGGESAICVIYMLDGEEDAETEEVLSFALMNAVEELSLSRYDCYVCRMHIPGRRRVVCCILSGDGGDFSAGAADIAQSAVSFFDEKLEIGVRAVIGDAYMAQGAIASSYESCVRKIRRLGGTDFSVYSERESEDERAVLRDVRETPSLPENDTEGIIEEVICYLKDRYTDPMLSVSSVAEHFGFSRAYFSSMFKEKAGMGLLEYIGRLRLDKAKECMRSDMKLGDIAEKCGYYDSHSLNVAFKKYEGMPPSAYRKSIK